MLSVNHMVTDWTDPSRNFLSEGSCRELDDDSLSLHFLVKM